MEAEQLGRTIATSSGPLATAVIDSPPALMDEQQRAPGDHSGEQGRARGERKGEHGEHLIWRH
jgi:hypothetical protein